MVINQMGYEDIAQCVVIVKIITYIFLWKKVPKIIGLHIFVNFNKLPRKQLPNISAKSHIIFSTLFSTN
jgi:hypothetical protein